jgi:radical SAM superfamily enzyme YgiQ (UPF0313 family)
MALHAVWRASGAPLYLSSEAGALALSLAGRANWSFDGEGRLTGAWLEKITYRRALDNRVLAKRVDPARPGRRLRRFLGEEEIAALLGRAADTTVRVRDSLASGALSIAPDAEQVMPYLEWLERAAAWTPARYAAEAGRFAAVYQPIPILPPDQYMALVVQATEGCSYNDCSFCTFYRDRPFRIKRVDELRAHLAGVLELLGRGVSLRRKLFLADANAVVVAQKTLLPMLDALNAALPILPSELEGATRAAWMDAHPWRLDGMYAFVSAPDALHKSAADFAALRARNVRRIYVGLETGCDPLRRFLRKQGAAADVRAAVETMKAGGLDLGVIFMAGIGGAAYRAAHFADTVALLQSLPLGPGDLIYVSPFVADAESPYAANAQAAGLRPLDEREVEDEEARFRAALLPWAQARGVKVSRYDVREFIY